MEDERSAVTAVTRSARSCFYSSELAELSAAQSLPAESLACMLTSHTDTWLAAPLSTALNSFFHPISFAYAWSLRPPACDSRLTKPVERCSAAADLEPAARSELQTKLAPVWLASMSQGFLDLSNWSRCSRRQKGNVECKCA